MRRLVPLLLVCLLTARAAADGAYVTESFGGTDVHDELGAQMGSAFRFRVAVGVRRGRWAVEGWMAGALGIEGGHHHHGASPRPPCEIHCYEPSTPDAMTSGANGLFMYGLDLKYLAPLARNLEVYVRGSMSRGLLDGDYAGRGLGVGAGIQVKGKVPAIGFLFWPLFFTHWGPKLTAAAFIDDGFEFYRLHRGGDFGSGDSIDARLSHLTVGFAVGSDF